MYQHGVSVHRFGEHSPTAEVQDYIILRYTYRQWHSASSVHQKRILNTPLPLASLRERRSFFCAMEYKCRVCHQVCASPYHSLFDKFVMITRQQGAVSTHSYVVLGDF